MLRSFRPLNHLLMTLHQSSPLRILHLPFSCSLFDDLTGATSPISIVDLRYDQELESAIAQIPTMPSILDSMTHVVCSPQVCGVTSDDVSSVKILRVTDTAGTLIDGGSNVCVTGNLHTLLDVTDITPIAISVALDGGPIFRGQQNY